MVPGRIESTRVYCSVLYSAVLFQSLKQRFFSPPQVVAGEGQCPQAAALAHSLEERRLCLNGTVPVGNDGAVSVFLDALEKSCHSLKEVRGAPKQRI